MRKFANPRARRAFALWLSLTCACLAPALTARAYRVDAKTQTVRIHSLKDFAKCQKHYESSGSELCLDALRAYAKRRPKDAFRAGKLAHRHFMHWLALDFFADALAKRASKRQCRDLDVRDAVSAGLALPPRYPAVERAKQLAQGRCWSALRPVLVADLKSGSGYYRDNVCPLLIDKQVDAQRCKQLKPRPVSALALLKDVDPAALAVDPDKTEVLRSARGQELMIARAKLNGREYVLLKFKEVESPWNDRVLVGLEQKTSSGRDYVVLEDEQERVALSERYGHYEAYPKGVEAGLWLNPLRPTTEPVHLPTRQEIAQEFVSVAPY